jgi:hypothetical protein
MVNTDEIPRQEWIRPSQIRAIFGISRSVCYELIALGRIRSVALKKPGRVHGLRLISTDSVRTYLAKLAEEQENERLVPVIARDDQKTGRKPAHGRRR